MSEELTELPEGWAITTLGDAVDVLDSRRIPLNATERGKRKGGYPYYGANGQADSIDDYLFDGNYVLIAEDGGHFDDLTRGVAYSVTGKFWVNNHAHIVDPLSGMSTQFFVHALNTIDWMQHVSGTTRLKLTQGSLLKVPLLLPPLNEQHRIVNKIEALRARSQRAKEALEAIPPLLDQFRQSVLAAAFRGDLTADWREQNPNVEPVSDLLERIHNNHKYWQGKHKQLDLPDPSVLPKIPSGWLWVTVEHLGVYEQQTVLTGPFGATLGREDFLEEGVPVITIGCLQSRGLDFGKAMYISQEKADELERYKLKAGDFLFSRMASVGRAAIVEEDLSEAIFNYHLMRLRLSRELIEAKYFLYYVRGAAAVSQYVKDVNHGATRDGINTQQLSKMPVALLPLEEQRQIVQMIENYFDRTHNIDDFVSGSLEELQVCNQSTLAKAFRGKLVPQNPNDEPASVLLERIRAERAKKEAEVKAAKTKGKVRGKGRTDQRESSKQISLPGLE